MSNQSARVLSAACLFAASLAAQAPAVLSSSITPRPVVESAGLRHGGGGALPGEAVDPGLRDPWALPRREPLASDLVPQEPDYSIRGMFQNAHGEYMAERGRYEPMASFSLSWYANQRVRHEPGSFDLLRYDFDADVPIALSPDGYMLLGAYSKVRTYDFSGNSAMSDETVFGAGLKFGFGAFLDSDTLLEVEIAPGLWSDGDGTPHHNDFDIPSYALLTMRAIDGFYWKVGLRYNQVYEDVPWFPYLGLSWDITKTLMPGEVAYDTGSWRLDVLLPEYVELAYWPTGDTGFQFGFNVDGAQYHVRTSAATGRQRANIQVQEVTTYLGMTHRFSDMLSLQLRAGAVLAGDTDLTTGAAGFNVVEGALDQGFFATVGLGVDW